MTTTPTVGRNDPCPCGSGKKYKKCCLLSGGNGRAREGTTGIHVTRETVGALQGASAWQADIVPFPGTFAEDPYGRPANVLVVSGDLVLAAELVGRAPSEIDDIAGLLEATLSSVAEATGSWPDSVEVRHVEIAEALHELIGARGIRVDAPADGIADLDDVALGLAGEVGDWRWDFLPQSMPDTWAGWGLPPERVADLFGAAAEFWRAEPWIRLPNERFLTVEMADGREWTATVLGNGGQEFGLALYASRGDLLRVIGAVDPMAAFVEPEAGVVSLLFDERGELPRPMQREIVSSGWEVAGPDAYPVLGARNTPAGGVSRRDADDLCVALRAIAAFAVEMPRALSRPQRAEWIDEDAAVTVVLGGVDEIPRIGFPFELWDLPERLSPAGPEGPGARPESVLRVEEGDGLVERLAPARAVEVWKSDALWATSEPGPPPDRGDARPGSDSPASGDEALQLGFFGAKWEDSSEGATIAARPEAMEPAPAILAAADGEGAPGPGFGADGEGVPGPGFGADGTEAAFAERVQDQLDTAVIVTVDPFFRWLVVDRRLSLATARKHARNAATFTAFLFLTAAVPIPAVTEYDLRRFLYEWYPRKIEHPRYLVDAMPVSLRHFFEWLAETEGIRCPWAEGVLGERDAYRDRYYEFPGGPWWDEDVQEWSGELWDDLDRRVLLFDPGLGEAGEWGEDEAFARMMGPEEARLEHELQRRWLLWRDEDIHAGVVEPEALRVRLTRRQRAWETRPHPGLDGLTPVEAIEREREEREVRAGQ